MKLSTRRSSGLSILALAFGSPPLAAAVVQATDPPTTRYDVAIQPASDRSLLDVRVAFRPPNTEPVPVGLPTNYYGTAAIYRYVTGSRASRARRCAPTRPGSAESSTPVRMARSACDA